MSLDPALARRLRAQMLDVPPFDARSLANCLESVIDEVNDESGGGAIGGAMAAIDRPDSRIAAELKQLETECEHLEMQINRYRQSNADLEARAVVASEEIAEMLPEELRKRIGREDRSDASSDANIAAWLPSTEAIEEILKRVYALTS